MSEIEKKKLKDEYTKLILFKVYGYNYKSDERLGVEFLLFFFFFFFFKFWYLPVKNKKSKIIIHHRIKQNKST
jgi:hypothetical protein